MRRHSYRVRLDRRSRCNRRDGWYDRARFVLERGRLRLDVPLHLAGSALFIIGSHMINEHASSKVARVVIFTSQTNLEAQAGQETNMIHVEISKMAAGASAREEYAAGFTLRNEQKENPPDLLYLHPYQSWIRILSIHYFRPSFLPCGL